MSRPLSKYVVVDASPARVAQIWDGVSTRLEKQIPARRRRWLRPVVFAPLLMVGALGTAVVSSLWFSRPSPVESVLHRAVLETSGDRMLVALKDGSTLQLGAETRVEVMEQSAEAAELHLRHGSIECDVTPRAGRHFSVWARDVEVRVIGTRFQVALSKDEQQVAVSVDRGTVEVRLEQGEGPVRRLGAGERWSVHLGTQGFSNAQERSNTENGPSAEDELTHTGLDGGLEQSSGSLDLDVPTPHGKLPQQGSSEKPSRDSDAVPNEPIQSAKELLDSANAARRAGDPSRAARAYEQLLARYPSDPRAGLAAFELGRLRMDSLGNLSGAVSALQKAVSMAPGSGFREDAMARLVRAYAAMGSMESCRSARARYLKNYPHGVHTAAVTRMCGIEVP